MALTPAEELAEKQKDREERLNVQLLSERQSKRMAIVGVAVGALGILGGIGKDAIEAFALSAFAEKNGDYFVSATISSNGVVLGKPRLVVVSDVASSVQISGENGYKLSINLTPSTNNTVFAKTSVKKNSGDINPSALLEIGKESIVKSGAIELHLLVNKTDS